MTDFNRDRGVIAADGTTKARIERAAIALFSAGAIDAVTTRKIAAKSGVSEGAIYRHYVSKAELAEAMFFAIHERLAEAIERAGSDHTDITSQTEAIVGAYCAAADDDWALFSYHLLNAHRFLSARDRTKKNTKNPVSETEKIIAAAMEKGDVPQSDPALKAAMALGVVMQAALHKVYGRIAGDLSNHKSALSKAALAVLKA